MTDGNVSLEDGQSGRPRRRWRRWTRRGEIVGLCLAAISVLVAVLAWQFPRRTSDSATPAGSTSAPVFTSALPALTASSPGQTGATPAPTTARSPEAGGRYLLDLQPQDGAANLAQVTDPGHRTFAVQCGTGNTDDQHRSVDWAPVGHYARLIATAIPTGRVDSETTTQVEILADNAVVNNQPALALLGPAAIDAPLGGAAVIGLRVTCMNSAVSVLFRDAQLVR
jgi:hypothetical protein